MLSVPSVPQGAQVREPSEISQQLSYQHHLTFNLFRKNVFKPKVDRHNKQGKFQYHDSSKIDGDELLLWAIKNQVDHLSFLCFPYNSTICQKQESLIDVKYYYDNGIKGEKRLLLNNDFILKGEADGSSFPSGGLRCTHRARAYPIRDTQSEIFIRKKNKVMYIPSMLVAHNGDALDDKTIFRKSQAVMKRNALKLLTTLGKAPKQIFLALGLEQQFFVIPKTAYLKRQDLLFAGRTLVGKVGAKSQQFSDHYYAKVPHQIEDILKEVESELLEVGIPFKTKHNEVANNQFEYSAIYCQAGKAIDQNLFAMEILKEVFDRSGYTVLLHEKPFIELNGSGKHANYSLNYVDKDGKLKNLFAVPDKQEDVEVFRLFILLTLAAIKKNNPLYFAAISPPGNEIRLGGHEAPPRIISAYLGETVSAIVDGLPRPVRKNLKEKLFFLAQDIFQEDTDRNRTSPFAYTGQKFQFRALGSSQNAAWPMAVIVATLAQEIELASKKLSEGYTVTKLIDELNVETKAVRFQGNGYSTEWGIEAKKRGLYVNESFLDILQRIDKQIDVFVNIGACSKAEILAKCEVMREVYQKTVESEGRALLNLATQKIIPRGMQYLQTLEHSLKSNKVFIKTYAENFHQIMDSSLGSLEKLDALLNKCSSYEEASAIRVKIGQIGGALGELCGLLEKDEHFPDLEDFLLK